MFEKYIENELNIYYNTINNSKLKEIIKYSLDGGKCIRGFIIKNIIETLTKQSNIWEPIVAIELIHGISLVLDDLPCMDNDHIRRNKPSTFVKFGERNAILISMYGISEAFKLLFNAIKHMNLDDKKYINTMEDLITRWSDLIGQNLVVGQMLDFKENIFKLLNINIINYDNLNLIYYKTSSLFIFAFVLGGLFSHVNNIDEYVKMGEYFGLMYQIMDDWNDMDNDDTYKNIVSSLGKEKCVELYMDNQNKLINLLTKNNIYSSMFNNLIVKMDSIMRNS